ncbi:hypothetical protein C0989_011511 [Termitomyces sp. Mn162]|nr:hypothetical protein C0989_011511 [Termitomyces sp. Mn162]
MVGTSSRPPEIAQHENKDQAATLSFSSSTSSSVSSSSAGSSSSHLSSHTQTQTPAKRRQRARTKTKTKSKREMAPASPDYELLETGMGPSAGVQKMAQHQHQRRRGTWTLTWKWKRAVLVVVCVIGVVWVLSQQGNLNGDHLSEEESQSPPPDNSGVIVEHGPSPPSPLTYETDADRTLTSSCTTPHRPTIPLVQYALIIDAGSTGSRIHVYKFNNCHASPTLEYEVFTQTQPGLSSYAHTPLLGAKSLDVLMDAAVRVVPSEMRRCTPVAVKATAGLRLLEDEEVDGLLGAVRERLGRWEFPVEGVVVMDGWDEGVYAWITSNYLLGTLEGGNATWAVLDLGGASTQIAFEPRGAVEALLDEDGHRYELTFAEKTHVLYQHSFLGYGLMHARQHVHQLVEFMAAIRANGNHTEETIGNACIAKGMHRLVELKDRNVTMVGDDVGSFDGCLRIMELVMAKDAICKTKPCSFNGVYQPSILETFPTGPVLLLSYFYDRLAPLLPLLSPSSSSQDHDAPLPLTIHNFSTLASLICTGPSSWSSLHSRIPPSTLEDLNSRPEYCLDLTFMYALLRRGYEFDDAREVRIAKRVRGTELGWALGAGLEVVGGELRCLN